MALKILNTEPYSHFLLTAPHEENLANGFIEPRNGKPYFFSATGIIGRRYAIVKVESGDKGSDAPEWTMIDIVEPSDGPRMTALEFGIACTRHAKEMYEKKTAPKPAASHLSVVAKPPAPAP